MESSKPRNGTPKVRPTTARELAETVQEGMQEAMRDAVAEHFRAGRPVATMRDGQVVWVFADGSVKPFRTGEPVPTAGH